MKKWVKFKSITFTEGNEEFEHQVFENPEYKVGCQH